MAKHPYPDTLYVRYEPDDEAPYFLAETELRAFAEPNGKVRIAVYRLEAVGDISADPHFNAVEVCGPATVKVK